MTSKKLAYIIEGLSKGKRCSTVNLCNMSHAKNTVKERGGRTLIIQGDPNAEQFYRAAGCNLTGKRESYSIPGRFLPVFTIDLTREEVHNKRMQLD